MLSWFLNFKVWGFLLILLLIGALFAVSKLAQDLFKERNKYSDENSRLIVKCEILEYQNKMLNDSINKIGKFNFINTYYYGKTKIDNK